MYDIDYLIQQLEDSGKDVFWQGQTSESSIEKLESLLDSRLPTSFKSFLANYGGGGVMEEEVSGIEDDDPTLAHRGTVYGDTLLCREDYALPENLIVVYLGADDVVWCLDVAQFNGNECPVVAFDVFSKAVKPLTSTFASAIVRLTSSHTGFPGLSKSNSPTPIE